MSKMVDARLKKWMPQQANGSIGCGNMPMTVVEENSYSKNRVNNAPLIKSPPDTTVYIPALQRQFHKVNLNSNLESDSAINPQVSEFVGMLRREADIRDEAVAGGSGNEHDNNAGSAIISSMQEARARADRAIVEAEQRAVVIETPPGLLTDSIPNINNVPLASNEGQRLTNSAPNMGEGLSDDDFFHLTCHIEPSLIHKIESGEFVELEKLLPKERGSFSRGGALENRLEWVQKDGSTYLVPATNRENKITGIRHWEQAFRAYATIYCAANPTRAKEIWQYVGVINTAASSFCWDNVYNYDITFRHLMAFNPNRSWAVCYNQMWNLSMRDPLPRSGGQNGKSNFQFNTHNNQVNGRRSSGTLPNKGKKPDYCWNFNKGVHCKYGKKCKFIERCSFCDSPDHGIHICPKVEAKESRKTDSKSNGNH